MNEKQALSLPTLEEADGQERYLIEDEEGILTSVPASKLDAWSAADRTRSLNKTEKALRDSILRSVFGSTR